MAKQDKAKTEAKDAAKRAKACEAEIGKVLARHRCRFQVRILYGEDRQTIASKQIDVVPMK